MIDDKRIFFCWSISHHTAPIEYREKVSPSPTQLDLMYQVLNDQDWASELTILATCNRLEIYGASYETDSRSLTSCIARVLNVDPDTLFQKSALLTGREALQHLFAVTAGLDSQIVGEVEITGQVKQAFLYAAKQRTVGRILNRAFQKSFQTSKWIRSNTDIGKGQINVATVAVDLALKVFGNLSGSSILVIGAGDIAEKTIAALRSRGARNLFLSNRTHEKARELASKTGGESVPFESLDGYLNRADLVLCSTASPSFILTEARMDAFLNKRAIRPLCLLDLALPRDIDPAIDKFPNVFLYNLDDLAHIAKTNLEARKEELGKCYEHIEKKINHLTGGPAMQSIDTTDPQGVRQT